MPELAPNQPCWIELSAPNQETAMAFYGAVFGWEFSSPGILGMGHTASAAGHRVAGIAPQPAEAPEGQPGFWSVYFRVADSGQFLSKVADAGGRAFMAVPVFEGRATVALLADPAGTGFGILSYTADLAMDGHHGVGVPYLFQLQTQDVSVAEFYAKVFGWDFTPSSDPGSSRYQDIALPVGGSRAGMLDIRGSQIPAHWRSYIQVDDVDATAHAVVAAGGALLAEPADTPLGRLGQFVDDQGAAFSVIAPR